jgi:hypothetical protein
MAYYSGLFRSQGNSIGDRWNHGQRNRYIDDTNTLKLSFCKAESFWSISLLEDDPCTDFIYQSPGTETFDVVEVAQENWLINTETSGAIDVDWLKIVCNDCSEETCHPDYGICSLDKDICECLPGRYGVNCEFVEDCTSFALDQRTTDDLASISGASNLFDKEYGSLTAWNNVTFNGMPIYTTIYYNSSEGMYMFPDNVNTFIVFTGRRWTLYGKKDVSLSLFVRRAKTLFSKVLPCKKQGLPDDRLQHIVAMNGRPSNWTFDMFSWRFESFSNISNGYYAISNLTAILANLRPIFFSSPIDYGEATFGFLPSSTSWVMANADEDHPHNSTIRRFPDEGQPLSARFLCTFCVRSTVFGCVHCKSRP